VLIQSGVDKIGGSGADAPRQNLLKWWLKKGCTNQLREN
jgi:hypothetical protein